MKKHITYAIAIAILACVWSTGCDEDEGDTTNSNVRTTSFDGAEGGCTNGGVKIEVLMDGVVDETQTQYICNGNSEQQNTCVPSCKENQTCQNGVCVDNSEQPKNCNTPGYVMCNNACIDPMTSNQYCGANEQCKGYVVCDKNQTCSYGECLGSSTTCNFDEHKYNDVCEKNSPEHCGDHNINCETMIDGWNTGTCTHAGCLVSTCQKDMHPENNTCVYDTVNACGKKGFVCADRVLGWQSGACTDGQCKVLQCIDGYHIDNGTGGCVQDTNQCCGSNCTKCTNNQLCGGGQCREQCPTNTRACNGTCFDVMNSIEHCGECNNNCNTNKPAHASTMRCSAGECVINECEANYRIESQNNVQICKADTVDNCGNDGTNCNAYEWWDGGTCTNGTCIPSACKGEYYLTQNEFGQNWCMPNDSQNCGGPGIKCTGGKCIDGRCLGNTLCDGVTHNLLNDLDHCGECDHRCKDGLICDNGKCKVGNGNAYCDGQKVVTGRIDHCGGCYDRCADSLICEDNKCLPGAGMTYCSNSVKDSRTDVDNCGACNHRCAEKLVCEEGECTTGNGLMYCNGVKIDSTRDSEHCGGCNNPCTAGTACCDDEISCGEDYYDIGTYIPICFKNTGNVICSGKIIDRSNDSANCGQCGNKCGIGEICRSGTCKTGTGLTYCDGSSINTSNNSNNCGQCGNACAEGVQCLGGGCMTNCSGTMVSLMVDSANCGVCGNNCGIGKRCVNGVCETGTGYTYCNGVRVNISSSDLNCGKCSNACSGDYRCIRGTCEQKYITFGHYEQDNDTANGKEPIEWRVLDKNSSGQYLIISEKVLDRKPYNTTQADIYWEKSTIRSWLNGYDASYNTVGNNYTNDNFINTAFTAAEKAKIIASNVPVTNDNPYNHVTWPINATTDKIFLLAISTATDSDYLTDATRQADATRYAAKQGVAVLGSESGKYTYDGTCTDVHCYANWWLRSPGVNWHAAAYVRGDGSVYYTGVDVDSSWIGVRPALWVQW